MKSFRLGLLCAVVLSLMAFPFGGPTGSQEIGLLKSNLDLPYNAEGEDQEEEDAPEIVFFYGSGYETDAVVFCLDESLSMGNQGRWELQKREINRTISELTDRTEFGLIFYGEGAYGFRSTLSLATQPNKKAAIGFVNSRRLTLGTCLGPGVVKSLKMLHSASNQHRSVIVAGDGRPTVCPFIRGYGRDAQLINAILQQTLSANPGLQIQVHTILVGTNPNNNDIDFMRKLARLHNGTFRMVNK